MTQEFVTLPRAVVEQAIEALEFSETPSHRPQYEVEVSASIALRAALEQPQGEREPVAWRVSYPGDPKLGHWFADGIVEGCLCEPLYTYQQPQREPLTLDQILDIAMQSGAYDEQLLYFARAIEAAHNIK